MNTDDEMLDHYLEYHYMTKPAADSNRRLLPGGPVSEEQEKEWEKQRPMWNHIKEQVRNDPQFKMLLRLMRRHTLPYSRREWAMWKWFHTYEMHRRIGGEIGGPMYDVWAPENSGTTGED